MDIFRLISEAEWHPGIGDPSFMGWLTVILYFFTTYQCFRVCQNNTKPLLSQLGRERLLWFFIFIALLCLGINKQLDFQSLLTEIGKTIAKEQGWYSTRRVFQKQFILTVVVSGIFVIFAMLVVFRKSLKNNLLAILGICILVIFLIVRAISFHHFDYFIGSSFLGVKMNWLLEISGILLILCNAMMLLRKKSKLL